MPHKCRQCTVPTHLSGDRCGNCLDIAGGSFFGISKERYDALRGDLAVLSDEISGGRFGTADYLRSILGAFEKVCRSRSIIVLDRNRDLVHDIAGLPSCRCGKILGYVPCCTEDSCHGGPTRIWHYAQSPAYATICQCLSKIKNHDGFDITSAHVDSVSRILDGMNTIGFSDANISGHAPVVIQVNRL